MELIHHKFINGPLLKVREQQNKISRLANDNNELSSRRNTKIIRNGFMRNESKNRNVLYEELKPILITLRLMGSFPFIIKPSGKSSVFI